MPASLQSVIDLYRSDEAFQKEWEKIIDSRNASLPVIVPIVEHFIAGQSSIEELRKDLTQALRSTDNWGATGTGWLMEINRLAKYYGQAGEARLRSTLTGLNAGNLGERIESFHRFVVEQKSDFKAQGKPGGSSLSPGNSAFLISLFAFWLDSAHMPPIYYISLRRGLKMLLNVGLLATSIGLAVAGDMIEVRTEAQHRAVVQALESIAATDRRVASDPYWSERLLLWVTENPEALFDEPPPGHGENADRVIAHEPLPATPEGLLRRLIGELRRQILVEEELVRRIYQALLAGHVILSGPPGTGKTELARLIPELLWQREVSAGANPNPLGPALGTRRDTTTAFATLLVTATDEWSVRTLIGGLAPSSEAGQPVYRIQYGHLTRAIFDNWAINESNPSGWRTPQRKSVRAPSILAAGEEREFRGRWLVVDEFNRAPIDLALGEALTALGGSASLRVPVDGGSAELALPRDFRIIGTLNSFDRNYLNQISEALKRRFAFIEVPPPTRQRRADEQAIVLDKALADVAHLVSNISVGADRSIQWPNVVTVAPAADGRFSASWATPAPALADAFAFIWNIFEIIRIYRQLGTAQAIALLRQMLIAGIVQDVTSVQGWVDAADQALCDSIADQLQVLLPDELEVLISALTIRDRAAFTSRLNALLAQLLSSPRRLAAQISALTAVVDAGGSAIATLSDDIEQYNDQKPPALSEDVAGALFHQPLADYALPRFTRRLRAFKMERGL